MKLIDIVKARLDAKNDCYLAELPSLALRDVRIDDELVRDNERMLTDGFYAEVTLSYDGHRAQENERTAICNREPAADPDVEVGRAGYVLAQGRREVHDGGMEDLLIRSIGLEPAALDDRAKRVALLRMVPFVERNYNLVELGPRGTGKSHLFQQISPYAHLISGGKATVAKMFVNNASGQRGLVCHYDVVCFDEVSGISFDQKDGVNIMKGYMASGQFSRGEGEHPGRRQHCDGGQLRCGCGAAATDRASAEPVAAGDAERHGIHGSPALLCAGVGFPEGEPARTSDGSFWAGERFPERVLDQAAHREAG